MRRVSLKQLIEKERRLLARSTALLNYRRLNWRIETNHRIRYVFERLVQEARFQGYPFDLRVSQHDQPNEAVIQVTSGRLLTGAITRTTIHDETFDERVSDTPIFEDGGALVASLSVSGHVAFIVYPRKSDRAKPFEEQIILFPRLDPVDVTEAVIERVICRYLLYIRSTSIYGVHDSLSLRERLILICMKLSDIRYQYKLSRSLISMQNEWAKIFAAGVLAGIVGYFTGSAK